MIGSRSGSLLAVLVWLVAAACTPGVDGVKVLDPGVGGATLLVRVMLGPDYVEGTLVLELDSQPIAAYTRTPWGASAEVPTPASGPHTLAAEALFTPQGGGQEIRGDVRDFDVAESAPALVASDPTVGEASVVRSAWIDLEFAGAVPAAVLDGFDLLCGGGGAVLAPQAIEAHAVEPHRVAINPAGELPAGGSCVLGWRGPGGYETLTFDVAAAGAPAPIGYDRSDPDRPHPFPDDFWVVDDASTGTGRRVAMPAPPAPPPTNALFSILLTEAVKLDGWSPIAHWVVLLPDAPDPDSIPQTPAESLDPLASMGLFDLDPASASYGERIPFRTEIRDDTTAAGQQDVLLLFPSIPLEPGGQYGLVVTRRARVDAGRPLEPSPFLATALAPPVGGEDPAIADVRALADEVLAVVGSAGQPPIRRDDVALVVKASIRSTDDITRDLLAVKEQVLAAPPPAMTVTSCGPPSFASPADNAKIAAVIEGTWEAPDWRLGSDNFVHEADGDLVEYPGAVPTQPVDFVLVLPASAAGGNPVPLVMYQHGNPGSAPPEVRDEARDYLAESGFATIGFTDILNRELSPGQSGDEAITSQVIEIFFSLVTNQKLPDAWSQTNAEQIAFLRAFDGLNDALPDGPFDDCSEGYQIDVASPFGYVGISQGANHASAFLPYAPEIAAAALVVGGSRLSEVLIHQQAELFIDPQGPIGLFFPELLPADVWAALSIFQAIHDVQDAHNHGRYWFREPLPVDGDTTKASVLVIEGLDDSLVPNHTTDSLAWQLDVPFLEPVQRDVPFLEKVAGPLSGNLPSGESGAFYQYVPLGIDGIDPTPGCVPPAVSERTANEGHFCAQGAAESELQRAIFFETALDAAAPTIVDPLTP